MDLTTRFGTITLSRTIEVFAPIFVLAHNWNLDDKHEKVLAGKKQYIKDVLLEAVSSKKLKGKIVSNLAYDADDEPVGYELDYKATSFDIKEATQFLFDVLRKNGSPILRQMVQGEELRGGARPDEGVAGEDDIDANIRIAVEAMPLHTLKKKVTELTNEKVKWDQSIVAAVKVGGIFSDKQIAKQGSEASFISEYKAELKGLPRTAISKIYKALPVEYRNTGGNPGSQQFGVDDETLDLIIEASVAAGFMCQKEVVKDATDLAARLSGDDYEVPQDTYLKAIVRTCKKVTKRNL